MDATPSLPPFNPRRAYSPADPELRPIAAQSTLRNWRHLGIGPYYMKSGTRILYHGWDLNRFLRLDPSAQPLERPHLFDPAKLYLTSDSALRILAARKTLYAWRLAGTGPDAINTGNRLIYQGDALNRFLESSLVRTTNDTIHPLQCSRDALNPNILPLLAELH